VGCQDYDDQFSSLESQISALATTVAGLSQVQSDLASLAGTVSSLASTVNGLGDQIDTAVSDGLSDIQDDIDAINTAVADVASSEEVSTLSDAVSDAQDDLTDLLAASSVFTGDVIVNSVNTLDAYLAMGAALNIVNGNVDITVSTSMDQTKVQTLVDNILTVVKDFKYTSAASTIAETTFNNLTGVQSLTITQGGGMRFPNLVSATNVYLKDDFESTVSVIHFGSLTSVSGIDTDAEQNTIRFTKATELHLTSLLYYPGATLTIETDEGAAMPFVLDDIDADGDTLTDGLTLTITGPASFSSSQIADGTLDFTDVKTVNLTDFKGAVTIGGDVESFTSNSLVSLSVDALTKVETVDVTGVVDPDATTAATKLGPAISLDTLGDLETVTIAGIAASVNLGTNNNLTTITISADVSGAITIDNNSDLTAVTVTGATASALDIDTNADLTAVTVDLTWGNSGTGTTVDGDLDVTGNTSLGTLNVSSDGLENLEVTGNTSLATLDFTGVTTIGATGTAVVNVYNNDLTASKLTDSSDGATNVADGAAGDLGSVTTTSGMGTLKTYLTAVAADADSAAKVYWDKVESFVDSEGAVDSETTDISTGYATSAEDATTILLLVANSADTGDPITTGKRSFILTPSAAALGLVINGIDVLETALTETQTPATSTSLTLSANASISSSNILDVATLALADVAGVSLAITEGGAAESNIGFGANTTAGQNSTTAAQKAFMALTASDTVKIEIDGLSVTVSGTQTDFANGFNAAAILSLIEKIVEQWRQNYVVGIVKSATAVKWSLTSEADVFSAALTSPTKSLTFTAKDKGSPAIGVTPVVTITAGKTSTHTNLGYIIGNGVSRTNSTGDDGAKGTDLILTVTNDTAGSTLGEAGLPAAAASVGAKGMAITFAGTGPTELTSTRKPNATASAVATALNIYPSESRTDVIVPEEANAAAASNAKSFSRVGWLG
jgi:hypothetical protein